MDRFVNKTIEKQTIYEIYRACRLCGAGGGYKMPIIQNVVNLEGCDVELKQKIRECVQIEVHQDDRMPPLICELCVDKVNDFYEFLEMCRQTNKRTRLRLGLPPQMMPRGAPDAGDCILGVTEPVYVNDEDSNEPLAEKKTKITRRGTDSKVKKEPVREKRDGKIKIESMPPGRQCRSVRVRQATPPAEKKRDSRDKKADNVALSKLQHMKSKRAASPPPKSILKKSRDIKREDSPVSPRLKRSREKEVKHELPAKRVKISAKPPARAEHRCAVCGHSFKAAQALASHLRTHTVTYTDPKCACNACGVWFATAEEGNTHHRRHLARLTPYKCRHCRATYKQLHSYETHAAKCLPYEEVPDVECSRCWKTFPTNNLLDRHHCGGKGGKCSKCDRSYMTRKSLLRHEKICRKGVVIIAPEIQKHLKPLQVRVAKCDPLLANTIGDHYDVSSVKADFGLDNSCVYPYITSVRIKSEPTDCMVKINDLDFASYVHWDSDDDSGDSDVDNMDLSLFTKPRRVESLTACALKTIFSKKFLGKVPRKFRRIKIENIINSALNDSLSDLNINDDLKCTTFGGDSVSKASDFSGICDDKVMGGAVTDDKDDDLFPKENVDEKITNDDFDSLFNDSNDKGERNDKVLDDKVGNGNDENSFNDAEDLASGKSENENHLTAIDDLKMNTDDKINDSELDRPVVTDSEEKVEDSSHIQGVEVNSKENNHHSEENNSQELMNSEEDVIKNEVNDEQKESTTEDSTKKPVSEISKEESQESTDNKELSNTTDNEVECINKAEDTIKQDEGGEKDENSTVKVIESDTAAHTINSESIQDSTKEHSVDNTEVTEKQSREDVKDENNEANGENDDSLVNGVNVDDDNLNMDDLEDWGDEELDDNKLMADLDEQIGEKSAADVKVTENSIAKAMAEKEMEDENTNNTEATGEKGTEDENRSSSNSVAEKEIGECKENANMNDVNNSEEITNKSIVTDDTTKEDLNMEKMDVDTDKITLDDLLQKKDTKITDCDNISDTEFNFD